MSTERNCGCKGIRSCLLCEQQSKYLADSLERNEIPLVYTYCPECNLCWPDTEDAAASCDFPLYVGRVKVIPEFLTEEEEVSAIASIDGIPWMPSQSGRRKQDFGPKVNFKRKKVKIGEFKGFPKFTESTLQKFKGVPELSDFQPVELCHLEYCPDRGSSIVPHVDDFWLWGERLVTVNLGSSTVLCLTPCSKNTCDCLAEASHCTFQSCIPLNQENGETNSCRHQFQDVLHVERSVKSLLISDATSENGNTCSREMKDGVKNVESSYSLGEGEAIGSDADSEELQYPENNLCHKDCKSISNISPNHYQTLESFVLKNGETNHPYSYDNEVSRSHFSTNGLSEPPKTIINSCNTMCRIFRNSIQCSNVRIRIILPPRSLLILAGCARYNWYHEIRREDVVSRRLAMTFRELTTDFLDGGEESHVGKSLLQTANHFYDIQ